MYLSRDVVLISEVLPDREKFKVQLQAAEAKEGSSELNSSCIHLYSSFFTDCYIFYSKVIEMVQSTKHHYNFFKHNFSWQKNDGCGLRSNRKLQINLHL